MLVHRLGVLVTWLAVGWAGAFDGGDMSAGDGPTSYLNDERASPFGDSSAPQEPLRVASSKVRKEIMGGGGDGDNGADGGNGEDETGGLVQQCLRAVNNCTNTQDTLLIHVALFLLSDRKWRPTPNSSQVNYVLSGCDKYEKFIQCVELHTNAAFGSQECFELSGFSDSFGFRWHRCNRFKRWVGMKKPSRRHSRSRYYFRRHGRMRI